MTESRETQSEYRAHSGVPYDLAVGDIFTGVPLFISPLEDFPLTSFVNMKRAEFLLKSPYACTKYEFYNPIETAELLTAV